MHVAFRKIKGATWKKHTSNKGKSKHIPFVLHSMGYTRIVLPAKPSSRANKRNNGARKREAKLIHIYIYTCQFPLTPSPSSIVRRRGPALREDRHTTLCVSDQGNNRTRGRRTEDEEEWTARSCAREAATENTDTFRESYFSHPASPATYF